MTTCRDCGRRWTSLVQAHCTVCHEHFGTDGLADRHRKALTCLPPLSVTNQRGEPVFRVVRDSFGLTWRSSATREWPTGGAA